VGLVEFAGMPSLLTGLHVKNYRSLVDVDIELGPVNVFFGPNGAGKSSILDALWFLRGCATQGVDATAAERDHGIGLLWDHAPEGSTISIRVSTSAACYEVKLGFLSGRIDPSVGESLCLRPSGLSLINRLPGSDRVTLYDGAKKEYATYTLREPEKSSLPRFLDFDSNFPDAVELNRVIRYVRFYHLRSMKLSHLRKFGSKSGPESFLWDLGENLWSVLRNMQGRRAVDERYDTIVRYMVRSFPGFVDLVLDAPSPATVYGSFVEKGHRQPIPASGISDGHLQMLLLLTALFAADLWQPGLILLDEPDLSLHPWAIAVLAEAIEAAAAGWQRQVLVSTHSPVLLSQFDASRILAVERGFQGTQIRRLSEIVEVKDLLEQYSPGSLYMSELVGRQAVVEG
jgi:predicted ATPase